VSQQKRRLGGALHNFLETYTSRYTTRDGFWLFGFLVGHPDRREADLLDPNPGEDWVAIARERLRDQLAKSGIDGVSQAVLTIAREEPAEREGRSGWFVSVSIKARVGEHADQRTTRVFAAPHDPNLESRTSNPR
jgi:hypothetical protein